MSRARPCLPERQLTGAVIAHVPTSLRSSQPEAVRAFLAATAEAYRWTAANPAEAAELFVKVRLVWRRCPASVCSTSDPVSCFTDWGLPPPFKGQVS